MRRAACPVPPHSARIAAAREVLLEDENLHALLDLPWNHMMDDEGNEVWFILEILVYEYLHKKKLSRSNSWTAPCL